MYLICLLLVQCTCFKVWFMCLVVPTYSTIIINLNKRFGDFISLHSTRFGYFYKLVCSILEVVPIFLGKYAAGLGTVKRIWNCSDFPISQDIYYIIYDHLHTFGSRTNIFKRWCNLCLWTRVSLFDRFSSNELIKDLQAH